MNSVAARYSANLWASRSSSDIEQEINRISKYWEMGPNFQFPGNAHYQFARMETLKKILGERTEN